MKEEFSCSPLLLAVPGSGVVQVRAATVLTGFPQKRSLCIGTSKAQGLHSAIAGAFVIVTGN